MIGIGSDALFDGMFAALATPDDVGGSSEFHAALRLKNGFYAFESALLVRGVGDGPGSLASWNRPDLWRSAYEGLDAGLTFFAEDIFGAQFALDGTRVVSFDPETGERDPFADSLEAWASRVLADYSMLTGYPLAHDWQMAHGPLALGFRLVPRIPFVLGGEFTVANLVPMRDDKAMRARAGVAVQIKGLPDGTQVEIEIDGSYRFP